MSKKPTIEELARIVSEGFDETATKLEVGELRADMQEGFSQVNATLARIENRLTHVDDTLIADHAVRIKRLEEAPTASRR